MKPYLAIFLSMFTALTLRAQSDSLGLPGDDLNLCGVLELFKTAKSPDDFEKALNKKDNKINNLDLNADGEVDYLRVIDAKQGDAHALIIRDIISKTESQDVAVIEIEKRGEKDAQLQIVGDEELYGKDYIIEPKSDKPATEKHWQGFAPQFVIVNVWYWPVVSYMWYPDYVVWVSPWYYGYYPGWWSPWAPMPYYTYYQYVYVYHNYYYYTNDYRMNNAHSVYQPRRVASPTVQQHTAPAHQRTANAAPTSANSQSPVAVRQPNQNDKVAPRGGEQQTSSPAPRQGQDGSTSPRNQGQDQSKAPRGGKQQDAQPAPSPRGNQQNTTPVPRQQDASPAPHRVPRQQRQPKAQTAPATRSTPAPRSSPSPRAPRGSSRPR
ncbi:MAG: hypothetical protein ABIQ40_17450 [Bacteroidia bacterium]